MHRIISVDKPKGERGTESEIIIPEFLKTVSALLSTFPLSEVPSLIADYLPVLMACPDLLTPEQRSLNGKDYEKHEVFLCPNDEFSVLSVVWPAGIYSPIHDHKTWCTFGVFDGVIQETRYRADPINPGGLDVIRTEKVERITGDVAHLPVGGGDIHCMHNPTDRAAVSVHVYGGNSVKIGPNVVNVYQETEITTA